MARLTERLARQRGLLANMFLGPGSTFRNRHRDWLYLGYLLLIAGILAAVALRR